MNKKGFSLVEVIIATSILSMSVFGIYKLIAENNKAVYQSEQVMKAYLLFPVIEACLEEQNPTGPNINISLDKDHKCQNTGGNTTIDNIDYTLSATKKSGSTNIWITKVESPYTGTLTGSYTKK